MSETKRCVRCETMKRIDDFTIDNSRSDGHYTYCKSCLKEMSQAKRATRIAKSKSEQPERFSHLAGETFKDLPGFVGEYQVSDMGRVKSLKTKKGMILKPKKIWSGYMVICLCKGNVKKNHSVHSLVMTTFVSARPENCVVNHIDGNKANNHLSNLEWVSQVENIRHSHYVLGNPFGKPPIHKGESHPRAKLTSKKVEEIRRLYASGNYSSRQLAAVFNVSKVNILNITNNKIWKG